jgi:hypothetical protein
MSHYEFKPGKKRGRNNYIGAWSEVNSKVIDLPFTVESLKSVLMFGANVDESPFTHQDIAHWCDRFRMAMFDVDTDKNLDIATDIAADVDAQWDMYLSNSYSLEELRNLDFSLQRMPAKWFHDWLKEIGND